MKPCIYLTRNFGSFGLILLEILVHPDVLYNSVLAKISKGQGGATSVTRIILLLTEEPKSPLNMLK